MQGDKLRGMAKELGLNFEGFSEQEVLKSIAYKVGLEEYNNLYDKDKLEEKLNYYLNNRNEWNKYNQEHNINNRKSSRFNLPKKTNPRGLPKDKMRHGLNNNIANKLKRKNNPFSFLNRGNKKGKSDNNNDSNNDNNDDSQNENGNQTEEIIAKTKKTILMVKIGLIIGTILSVALVVFMAIYYITSILGISMDFSSLGSTTNLDPSLPYYNEAKKYHENLNKAVRKYSDSCGVFLNKSYIHGTLTYLWSISDLNYNEKKQYQLMADNVDDVASLMVNNCVVDYEVGGAFYNKLKESRFLKKYYSVPLEYMEAESIVEGIFEYVELGIDLSKLNSGFISDNLKVTMGTCEQPYNKKLLNEGSSYSSTVSFSDYVRGVILGEAGGSTIKEEYKEYLKAFTIIASSYALGRADYQSGAEEIWVHNGNCWQLSCDINEGCTYCYDSGDFGTTYTGSNRSCNNVGYRKQPMTDQQRQLIDEVFEEVFGTIMINNNDGKIVKPQYRTTWQMCGYAVGCLGYDEAINDAKNGMNYQQILDKFYDNYTLSNMVEDSYAGDVSYSDGGYTGNVVFYDQNDYYNYKFCGTKEFPRRRSSGSYRRP